MKFELTILGSSSATPIFNRNPTAQVLHVNGKLFLIDCGEGTQQQLLRYGINAQRIEHIFISHLHGDHYLGLVGLLSSLNLNGRTKPVHIYGPPELKEIVDIQLKHSQTQLRYPLQFNFTQAETPAILLENNDVRVETIILNHRIPCTGFKFSQQKRPLNLIKSKIETLEIPVEQIPLIKQGADFVDKFGRVHLSADLTTKPQEAKSYAYCSDTLYSQTYLDSISGVDLLYHEATFMHNMLKRAEETYHTTALQAGKVALEAQVKYLLIGHFSARYRELEPLLAECKTVFNNTSLAIEGRTFDIGNIPLK
ncbi:MAG: ribonuclease Z [Sphingobacteriaceae bacterium]|nr:MAG: ribonuclease Z [Pedobacter sp.]